MAITPLRVVGNKFVDQAGNVVRLVGCNNIGSHYACLTNQGGYDAVFGGVPYDLRSLKIMQSWGMNCVRVSINAGCWLNCCVSPFTSGATYQNAILSYIDSINSAGMYCILNLINTASGTGEMADVSAINFWTSICPMLATRPLVILEAYNEPHTILLWATWLNGGINPEGLNYTVYGMQSLINTIRGAGDTHIILLDGLSYAGDFSGFIANIPTDSLGQLGASWHIYSDNPHTIATDIGSFFDRIKAIAAVYPITATEFGGNALATVANNQKYYMSVVNYCDYIGAGHLMWAWCEAVNTGMLSDYVNFLPSAYGLALYQHLQRNKTAGKNPMHDTRLPVIPTLPY